MNTTPSVGKTQLAVLDFLEILSARAVEMARWVKYLLHEWESVEFRTSEPTLKSRQANWPPAILGAEGKNWGFLGQAG